MFWFLEKQISHCSNKAVLFCFSSVIIAEPFWAATSAAFPFFSQWCHILQLSDVLNKRPVDIFQFSLMKVNSCNSWNSSQELLKRNVPQKHHSWHKALKKNIVWPLQKENQPRGKHSLWGKWMRHQISCSCRFFF